jgi:Zn-dependent protease with chaperone function
MSRQDFGYGSQTTPSQDPSGAVTITPSAAEVPLRMALLIIGSILWILFVVTVVGLVYGLIFGVFLFFVQMSLIAHLRGSSVKLGPNQMPEIYERVVELSRRIGLKKVPDAYLLQSGGMLNAFATRFGRANFIVLYSELVEACGNNVKALDFIIAHELGHLHRGHLNWRWLVAPALFIPFLGSAYSRACEYTCDRYGFLAPRDPDQRLDGLCILAAGPQLAAAVDRRVFAAQDRDLNTAFMKLGEWFSTHPPLALRLSALAPGLKSAGINGTSASLGAVLIAGLIVVAPIGGLGVYVKWIMDLQQNSQKALIDAQKQLEQLGSMPPPSYAPPTRNLPSTTQPSSAPSLSPYSGQRTR